MVGIESNRNWPPVNEPDRTTIADGLEEMLANALEALESAGEPGLERFLAAHSPHAPRLREALADLRRTDLFEVPPPDLPARLGEFRIRGQLGAGGMGVVYLAEQTSLGREVALKVVRPELLFFDGARERFRREIEAVARLEHPAIVPILATGSADGIPYYAMPRIRGRSAEAVVKMLGARHPSDLTGGDLRTALAAVDANASDTDSNFAGTWWQAVVRLVRKASLGIHHAHTRGILHRDLKPSNLMLTADGRAIVLDFGLAHAQGDASMTRTGAAAGSPAYMAPEQVRGEHADERTDVYGLAATLHCLLSLRPPFPIADPETLRSEILAGTRQALPARASLPVELGIVLDTAMDRDRMRRYPSAAAFADDLQAVLEGKPIVARRLPLRVRLQRFAGRHRALATAATASAVFVVVLPAVLWWQQHAANVLLSAQVERSDHSVNVSVDAVEKLLAAIGHDRMMHVPAAQNVAAEMLRGAIDLFDELATDDAQASRVNTLRIQTLLRLTDVETARGRLDDAIAVARRAEILCGEGELAPRLRSWRGMTRRVLAGLLLDTNQNDEVEALIKAGMADLEAVADVPELQERVRSNIANLHSQTAVLAERRGDPVAHELALRQAVTCWESCKDRLALASAQTVLSHALKHGDQLDEALALAEAAIRIATSPDTPFRGWPIPRQVEGTARVEQSDILDRMGREAESIAAYRLALQTFDLFLRDYPEEWISLRARGAAANDLALIHVRRKEWSLVRPLLEGACRDQLAVLARQPTDAKALLFLGNHRRTLAICLHELGDLAALEPVARALGQMPGNAMLPIGAARGLLRCAQAAEPAKASALRAEALDLLVEGHRRNGRFSGDDPLYAPLRDEPRFQQVAVKKGGG